MPLYGGVFLHTLRAYRIAWIGGRYGGGKSSLAVRLAIEFLERGWAQHAIGNFPCVVFESWRDMGELRDCFIVLDEAGAWMKERDFEDTVAFLRKRNLFLVLSSVLPPPIRARALNVQRTINFQTIGIDLWKYEMSLSYMNVQERASLWWWRPKEIWGLYDTADVATNSRGIVQYVKHSFSAGSAGGADDDDDDDIFYLLREREAGVRRPPFPFRRGPEREADVRAGDGVEGVEVLRGVVSDLYQTTQDLGRALSMDRRKGRRRRR